MERVSLKLFKKSSSKSSRSPRRIRELMMTPRQISTSVKLMKELRRKQKRVRLAKIPRMMIKMKARKRVLRGKMETRTSARRTRRSDQEKAGFIEQSLDFIQC